jgi:hypothetical protein
LTRRSGLARSGEKSRAIERDFDAARDAGSPSDQGPASGPDRCGPSENRHFLANRAGPWFSVFVTAEYRPSRRTGGPRNEFSAMGRHNPLKKLKMAKRGIFLRFSFPRLWKRFR